MTTTQARKPREGPVPTVSNGEVDMPRSTSSRKQSARVTAETMAGRQRDISVSEFFAKNRHLLGFDNPRKALLTTVKEAVDNSLDACEEAGILPDVTVVIEDLQPERPTTLKSSRYRLTIVDNGPGIVKKQVEHIFGRLLYGSKFHRLKMSRGQQGIGISAAGMYGLITTGKPMVIHTRPSANKPAHHIELAMNTKTNRAEVTVDTETRDFPPERLRGLSPGTREEWFLRAADYPTGTSVSIELEGRYQRGRGSVDEFLELTAIANPHARITFVPPSKESAAEEDDIPLLKDGKSAEAPAAPEPEKTLEANGVTLFPRGVSELPPETKEIQPHPKGIELGILLQMLKEAEEERRGYSLFSFLQDKFSRVSAATASSLCAKVKLTSRTKVTDVDHALAEKLFRELQDARLPPPPTDCLAPIGVRQLLAGMLKGVKAEFYAASSRDAAVYRGRPFQIEAAIAFGGELVAEETARVIRFANRVPLLFQQSACSSFKAVVETSWKNYNLQHPRGSLPVGPLVIMIHMASVWVPFTSESKEAIADYDEIRKEMKLALMECGRKLGTYLRKRQAMRRQSERRDVFERYIGEIAKAVHAINGTDAKRLYDALLEQARVRTAVADQVLDDEGKVVKDDPGEQDGVIIVESAIAGRQGGDEGDSPPLSLSKAERAKLKVTGMAREDEDPSLLDVEPAKRSARSGRARQPKSPVREKRAAAREAAEPAGQTPKKIGTSPKGTKPKMRLVNGKLVPADEPGLF
ncbi:MAG: DNA topoisomerase VI subunit B [Phycisphaeraceae bacterium]|nr:DNA topoisomerase VI subunit B [Phycisphaeraceae bacterium]